jgi:heme-degrading monooxygenase HmoA
MSGMNAAGEALIVVNRFVARPGCLDELIRIQQQALPQLASGLQGWRGTRLLRGIDGDSAVLLSAFDSEANYVRLRESAAFAAHRERLMPLIERAEPGLYGLVLASGML